MLTYEKFLKHAARMTKAGVIDFTEKPSLEGVKHFDDGRVAVTDSHRAYIANVGHGKEGEPILHPATLKPIDAVYPNVLRLFDMHDTQEVYRFDLDEMIYVADVVNTFDEEGYLIFNETAIHLKSDKDLGMNFHHMHDVDIVKPFALRALYFLDVLKLLKDAGCKTVEIQYKGHLRPLFFEYENVQAIVLPVRIP